MLYITEGQDVIWLDSNRSALPWVHMQGGMPDVEEAVQQMQAAINVLKSEIAGLQGQLQGCTPEKELLLLQQVAAKEQQVLELRKQETLLLQQHLRGESGSMVYLLTVVYTMAYVYNL